MISTKNKLVCVILAGGKGSRLDKKGKYNQVFNNMSLLEHVYNKVKKQLDVIAVNFNNKETKSNLEIKCIYDIYQNDIGPLAGIHSAIKYSNEKFGEAGMVCTVPVDTPFLPNDLINKLYQNIKKNSSDITVAKSGTRTHPTIAIWKNSLLIKLEEYISNDIRKIDRFTGDMQVSYESWKIDGIDPFFNINNYDDLKIAETMIKI